MIRPEQWVDEPETDERAWYGVVTSRGDDNERADMTLDGDKRWTDDPFQAMELAYQSLRSDRELYSAEVCRTTDGGGVETVAVYLVSPGEQLQPWTVRQPGPGGPTTRPSSEPTREAAGAADRPDPPTPPDGSNHPEPGTAG